MRELKHALSSFHFLANKTVRIMEVTFYMNTFNIRIIEDDGDTHIYTDASKIGIVDNTISIDRDNERNIHRLDEADEIIIKTNR